MNGILTYKLDILSALKDAGYNTSRLRKEKIIGEGTIQAIRNNEVVGINALDKLCTILDMEPGDLIKRKEEES